MFKALDDETRDINGSQTETVGGDETITVGGPTGGRTSTFMPSRPKADVGEGFAGLIVDGRRNCIDLDHGFVDGDDPAERRDVIVAPVVSVTGDAAITLAAASVNIGAVLNTPVLNAAPLWSVAFPSDGAKMSSRIRFSTASDVFETFKELRRIAARPPGARRSTMCANCWPLGGRSTPSCFWPTCCRVAKRFGGRAECVGSILGSHGEDEALRAADAWVRAPEEERRRTALAIGLAGDQARATTWLALAVGRSGGSVSAPDQKPIFSSPSACAQSVTPRSCWRYAAKNQGDRRLDQRVRGGGGSVSPRVARRTSSRRDRVTRSLQARRREIKGRAVRVALRSRVAWRAQRRAGRLASRVEAREKKKARGTCGRAQAASQVAVSANRNDGHNVALA